MEISKTLKKIILECGDEIDTYQFEGVYSKLSSEWMGYDDTKTFTEMMLSVGIDPAKYLGYIPQDYLLGSEIKKYNIPSGVTSIREGAFSGCHRLTSIAIPDGVTSIEDGAFYSCRSLTSIAIPNSVTSIGEDALYSCRSLTGITIPDSVVSIGSYAFAFCDELTSVTVPDSMMTIGSNVFEGCSKLSDINYEGTVEQWKKIEKRKEDFSRIKIHCVDGDI